MDDPKYPRKKVTDTEPIAFQPEGRVRDLKLQVDSWIEQYGQDASIVKHSYYDDEPDYEIKYVRLERDNEYARRLKTIAANEARKKKEKEEKPAKEAAKRAQLEKDCRELAEQLGFILIPKDPLSHLGTKDES